MKFNKIAIIAILAIFTVILAGSASAFDLGFLTGDDSQDAGPTEVTVGGIDFTIPAGFTENEEYKMDNESGGSPGVDYFMSAAGFEDESKENAIYIMVADYGDYNVTNDILESVAGDDAVKKTINGKEGYFVESTNDQAAQANEQAEMMEMEEMTADTVYIFMYAENGDLVYIGATDEAYFNDVIN